MEYTRRGCLGHTMPLIEIDATSHSPLGMPPAEFLRDYWQKHPLLIRNAFPAFEAPLTPEDLAGLACEEAALSRIVTHDRAANRWTLRHGPFEEDEFPALPHHDWSLLVQDVDKWDDDVRGLLARFDFLPRWRIDDVMVSFAAPGGSVGAHVDQYDVFLLQGQGTRRWQISSDPQAPLGFRDDSELKLLSEFTPTHEWTLAAGDMLYLPPGVPHHGVAIDACLTFSIGMRAPSHAELIGDFADTLAAALPETERYADPDLQPPSDPAEIDDAALDRAMCALLRLQGQDRAMLHDWLGSFLTRYRSAGEVAAPPRPPSRAQIEARLARGAVLQAHPLSRRAWSREGVAARLYVSGEAHACALATAQRLCNPHPLGEDDWRTLPAASQELLHALVRAGHFLLAR
jgi:50S ribosomal protein L16 3-hydroxylase